MANNWSNNWSNNYNSTTETARSAYGAAMPKAVKAGSTFKDFHEAANIAYKVVNDEKQQYSADIEKAKREMSREYANKYIANRRIEHEESLRQLRDELKNSLDKTIEAKKAALESYIIKAPTTEQITTLQAVQMRGNKVSKTELDMLVKFCGDNYQALSAVHNVAENSGFEFTMPVSADAELESLEMNRQRLRAAIDRIDNAESDAIALQLFKMNAEQPCFLNTAFAEMDSNTAIAVMPDKITIKQRIDEARAKIDEAKENNKINTLEALHKKVELSKLEMENPELHTEKDRQAAIENRIIDSVNGIVGSI